MANVQIITDSIPALPEVGRQDLDVNVTHVNLPDNQIIPCTPDCPRQLLAQVHAFRSISLHKELGGRAARIPEGGCAEQPLIWEADHAKVRQEY